MTFNSVPVKKITLDFNEKFSNTIPNKVISVMIFRWFFGVLENLVNYIKGLYPKSVYSILV